MTEYHRLWGLQTTDIHFSQFWRLKGQDQGIGRSGVQSRSGDPTSCFTDGIFSLCPHMEEGVRELSGVSLIRTLIPSWGPHPHDLITSQSSYPPDTITLGVRFPHMNLEGTQTQSIAPTPMSEPLS